MELSTFLLAVIIGVGLWIFFGAAKSNNTEPLNSPNTARRNNIKTQAKKSKTTLGVVNTDHFQTLDEVANALREAGLESSNLIVGVDYTKSNTWTGKNTFGGLCLHNLGPTMNPYQTVINSIGRTLEPFDEDKLIPAFGFGDTTTSDKRVFPFFPDRFCNGFAEVLQRYNDITPQIQLSGPTNFAPIIRETIEIVKKTKSYHVLLIIADGQVNNKSETIKAIVDASGYPISIILVGVGDGPWDMMVEFDDEIPDRVFDNFQFVNFHEIFTKFNGSEAAFAMLALTEIPGQYKDITRLGLLNF